MIFMKTTYLLNIFDIASCAVSEFGRIITAHIKVMPNNKQVWAFIDLLDEEWAGFKRDADNSTQEYRLEFSLLPLVLKITKSKYEKKEIVSASHLEGIYFVNGKIVDKKFKTDRESDRIYVDCGFVVSMWAKKNRFKIGDWIKAEGRLDAHLVSRAKR